MQQFYVSNVCSFVLIVYYPAPALILFCISKDDLHLIMGFVVEISVHGFS